MNSENKRKSKVRELETHHNQALTPGAQARARTDQTKPLQKKVVALQLSPKEQLAIKHLGGIKGLKVLLCPEGICVACRKNRVSHTTSHEAYCLECGDKYGKQTKPSAL